MKIPISFPIQYLLILFTFTIFLGNCKATDPFVICTTADKRYFPHLINLIGSIHKHHDIKDIKEIMVFNLGLEEFQKEFLTTIEKVNIYDVEITHPDILTLFNTRPGINKKPSLGWYAWKPVILKQALDKYNSILYLDAGVTICRPLDPLIQYIEQTGYFFHNAHSWKMKKQTTQFVIKQFKLKSPENKWILETQGPEGGLIGVSRKLYDSVIYPAYLNSFDLRYFEDDGSSQGGFGTGRHDQSLLGAYILLNKLVIHHHFENRFEPILLTINNEQVPFYICPNKHYRHKNMHIYVSRHKLDLKHYAQFIHHKSGIYPTGVVTL